MEHNNFIKRRREIMVENGDEVSIPDDDQDVDLTSASHYIEITLSMIDQIIPTQRREGDTDISYSVQIRNHVNKLREEGKTDEEIYASVSHHISLHQALARELARKGIPSINLFIEPQNQEFDQ